MKAIEYKPGDSFGELTIEYLTKRKPGRWWLCRCSCGNTREVQAAYLNYGSIWHCGCQSGKQWLGRSHSQLTKDKIRAAHKGRPHPWQRKLKHPSKFAGCRTGPRPLEWRQHISAALKGKKKEKEHVENIRKAAKQAGLKRRGIPKSIVHRKKIAKALKGRKATETARANYRLANSLERNPAWRGGVSYIPYPTSFNRELKNRIKSKWDHTCQLCKVVIHRGTRSNNLQVHHIDYDKNNMDDSNLIALCNHCNLKVNWNREAWHLYFMLLNEC